MTTEPIYLSPRQPNYFLILLYALLFIAIFLFCFKGCKKDTIIINKLAKDTIQQLDKQDKSTEIKQIPIVKKIDSIALLTNQLNITKAKLYKAGRVTITNNICNTDIVLKAYDSLYNLSEAESKKHSEVIKAWRYLDSLKQNRLDIRDGKIFWYKSIVKSDSLVIDSLTRSKKKYWRGFKHGLIVGAVGVELINVGAKVVPLLK